MNAASFHLSPAFLMPPHKFMYQSPRRPLLFTERLFFEFHFWYFYYLPFIPFGEKYPPQPQVPHKRRESHIEAATVEIFMIPNGDFGWNKVETAAIK
jgi:hypothetical protein